MFRIGDKNGSFFRVSHQKYSFREHRKRIVKEASGKEEEDEEEDNEDEPPQLYSVRGIPSCKGLLPKASFHKYGKKAPIIHNLDSLTTLSEPSLVYLPRKNIQISLAAFSSAFAFSILSGRTLVRFHAGPHRQVLSILCRAFTCPSGNSIDSAPWKDRRSAYRTFVALFGNDEIYVKSDPVAAARLALGSPKRVLWVAAGKAWDGYWMRDRSLGTCLRDAVGCTGKDGFEDLDSCVQGRALRWLLGEPSGEMLTFAELATGLRARERIGFDVAVSVKASDWEASGAERCLNGSFSRFFFDPTRPVLTRHGLKVKPRIYLTSDSPSLAASLGKLLGRFGDVFWISPNEGSPAWSSLVKHIPLTLLDFFLVSRAVVLVQLGGAVDRLAVNLGKLAVVLAETSGDGNGECGFSVARNGRLSKSGADRLAAAFQRPVKASQVRSTVGPDQSSKSTEPLPDQAVSQADGQAKSSDELWMEQVQKWSLLRNKTQQLLSNLTGLDQRLATMASWPSPLISPRAPLPAQSVPACPDLLQRQAVADVAPIRSVKQLTKLDRPVLVFIPRHGLGNSLRSFQAAFAFCLLSGRRIVLFQGGPHAQSVRLLCRAFHCGADIINDERSFHDPESEYQTFMALYKDNEVSPLVGPAKIRSLLRSPEPVLYSYNGNNWNSFWSDDDRLRNCMLARTECRTVFCVAGFATNRLLRGGPTDELGLVVESYFRGERTGVIGGVRVPEGLGLNLWFDVGIHIRTLSRRLELTRGSRGGCQKGDERCYSVSRRVFDQFVNGEFWGCLAKRLDKKLSTLQRKENNNNSSTTSLNIFLATDNTWLRPFFTKKLARFGTVFHSTVIVAHTSKSSNVSEGLASMADFYLLGRCSEVLAFKKPFSTFAQEAVTLANTTLAAFVPRKTSSNRCRFMFQHFV